MADPTPETVQLVDALLTCSASMTLIIDHMARAPGASASSAVATLRTLLHGVLAPLEEAFGQVELAGAARAVEAATERMGTDLFLVPHSRPATRRRGPLRPCA